MSWAPWQDLGINLRLTARAVHAGRLELEVRDPYSHETMRVELWPGDEALLRDLLNERDPHDRR